MLNSRDIDRLRPDVAANCRKWLELCKDAGLNVLVTQTVRDKEYQEYLYAQGRTRPGDIVTNGKVPTFHADTVGCAFDFCKNVKGHEYDDNAFFAKAAALAKGMGFSWGGDWKSFVDKPHIQWDNGGEWTSAMIRAGKLPPTMPLWGKEEDEMMSEQQFYEMFLQAMAKYTKKQNEQPVSGWAKESMDKAKAAGVMDGSMPKAPATREQIATMLDRIGAFG